MKFKERRVQFPNRKKLVKVNERDEIIATEEPIFVHILRDEGELYEEGTQLTQEVLNSANWRDDDSLSFKKRLDNILPTSLDKTQIVTTNNGETWIIPPDGKPSIHLDKLQGTEVKVSGVVQKEWNADNKLDTSATAENSKKLNGKLESQLDVKSANTASTANLSNGSEKLTGMYTSGNKMPQDYFANGIAHVSEVKLQSSLGLSDASYGIMLTNIPGNNSARGLPTQILYSQTGRIFTRNASSATSWNNWNELLTSSGLSVKDNSISKKGWSVKSDDKGTLTFLHGTL